MEADATYLPTRSWPRRVPCQDTLGCFAVNIPTRQAAACRPTFYQENSLLRSFQVSYGQCLSVRQKCSLVLFSVGWLWRKWFYHPIPAPVDRWRTCSSSHHFPPTELYMLGNVCLPFHIATSCAPQRMMCPWHPWLNCCP